MNDSWPPKKKRKTTRRRAALEVPHASLRIVGRNFSTSYAIPNIYRSIHANAAGDRISWDKTWRLSKKNRILEDRLRDYYNKLSPATKRTWKLEEPPIFSREKDGGWDMKKAGIAFRLKSRAARGFVYIVGLTIDE